MPGSSNETKETETTTTPTAGRNMYIWILLGRIKLGMRRAKGWILRGGASQRQTHSVGKRDSCEMRKLCGGHDKSKEGR